MKVSATELRQNLYRIVDHVLETGEAVEILRKGKVVRLVADSVPGIWDRLEVREAVVGDPEDIVSIDWSREWSGGGELDDPLP
ncbi:MAG: type II toxin-antitoxin system Phd/YefM family antitoxin [Spirochaetales bacterium]|nr:type II toxin-antitoxin system Phd/YefM family antitoxin [Spirochaetales bacterium]